ncbi:MAG: hypothetical protein J6X93_05705 [Bacilli bacterium]|nr:hypothetical protein [Bacilli bacterium]
MALYKNPKARMVARIVIFSTSAIIAIMLLLSYYGLNVGTFTVVIDNEQQTSAEMLLSETADFKKTSQRLNAVQALDLDCLGVEDYELVATNPEIKDDIPQEILAQLEDLVGGSQNQEGYFCYTFYVLNSGNTNFDYTMDLNINSTKNNADAAIRIMLVWDREYNNEKSGIEDIRKVYAKAQGNKPGQTPNALDYCSDDRFASSTKIFTESRYFFTVGSVDKVSILMWIHGWDDDATDEVKSGKIRLTLRLRITDVLIN